MRSDGSWESIGHEGAGAQRHGDAGYCVEIGRSGEDGHRETCEEALAIIQAKHNAKYDGGLDLVGSGRSGEKE